MRVALRHAEDYCQMLCRSQYNPLPPRPQFPLLQCPDGRIHRIACPASGIRTAPPRGLYQTFCNVTSRHGTSPNIAVEFDASLELAKVGAKVVDEINSIAPGGQEHRRTGSCRSPRVQQREPRSEGLANRAGHLVSVRKRPDCLSTGVPVHHRRPYASTAGSTSAET